MDDARPLPEYGEYATPEEQARAMGRPTVDLPPPNPAHILPQAPVAPRAVPTGFANRFFTVFLLGIGGLLLLADLPVYLDFRSALKLGLSEMGKSVSVPSSVGTAGIWMLVVNAGVYLLTVLWAIFAVRLGRPSAYIPIVGCIVFVLSAGIVLDVLAPGFVTQLGS